METLEDPLKSYFEEKATALFLRRDVLKVFIDADNHDREPYGDHLPFQSDSLAGSFIDDDIDEPQAPPNSSTSLAPDILVDLKFTRAPHSDVDVLREYESTKMSKQVSCNLMMRVNDELQKEPFSFRDNLKKRLEICDLTEIVIHRCVSDQSSTIIQKVIERRLAKLRNKRFECCVLGSPSNTDRTAASKKGSLSPCERSKGEHLIESSKNSTGVTPECSFQGRLGDPGQGWLRQFEFQTNSAELRPELGHRVD